MRKFLSVSLKPQWKTILIIIALIAIHTFFQMQIIELFSDALTGVKKQNVDLLLRSGLYMLMYTAFSMISIYAVSFCTTRVASNAAYILREKIFHILMNLPKVEIDKFKVSGLVTRSTRGVSSEQGFIVMILEDFILIPVTFVAVVYEISLIDMTFAIFFLGFIGVISAIVIWKMKKVVEIFFRAKKTYGKLNLLFLTKVSNISDRIPFKKQEYEAEFDEACDNSYDKNVKYIFSQYYIGPVLMWALYVFILIVLGLVNSGFTIGFETDYVIDSVIITVYIAFFITTLAHIPALIDRWPRAYATSVRLEEVLNLEDKTIKSKNTDIAPEPIEIVEEDLADGDDGGWAKRDDLINKFMTILKEDKVKIIMSVILLTVSTLCMVNAPKIAGTTIDLLISNFDSSNDTAIYTNIVLLIALYSGAYLFKLAPRRIMGPIGEKVAYDLRMKLFDKIDAVGSENIKENSKGLFFSRLNNDVMNLREFVSSKLTDIYAQFISIILVLVLIFLIDIRLGLVYLFAFLLYIASFYICDYKSKKHYENHQKHLGRMMSYFERGLANRDAFHEKGFKKINQTVIDYYSKSKNITNFMVPMTELLTNVTNISVYIVGISLFATNEIQLGTLLAIIMYAKLFTKPLKKISNSTASIENSLSSLKRIFAIIDYKKDNN